MLLNMDSRRRVAHRSKTGQSVRRQRGHSAIAAVIETLEIRQLLTNIVVNTTADSALADANIAGPTITLREAINYSNANPGNNTISFASSLNGQVISPTVGEPYAITSGVSIVGPAANELSIGFATPVNGSTGLFTVSSGATASISGLTLENGGDASDSTSYQAAGIYVAQGNLSVANCVITGMTGGLGTADANGISAPNGGTIVVTNSTFSDNGGDSYASCIYVAGGATTITGCTFTGNVSQNTIQLENGTAAISGSTFTDNTLEYQEQEIDNGANTTVTNCTFTGNTSYYGAAVGNDGTIAISGCTFFDNALDTRPNDGFPAIFNYAGTMTVTNTTIEDNVTTGVNDSSLPFSGISGGGIGVNSGSVTVTYTTITGNTANYGGGIQVFGGSLSLQDSIVAGNIATVAGNDIYGTITSLGNNIIGDGSGGSGYVSSDLVGTDASPINPGLGTLGNYGGPTQTIPLLAASPAIGAAAPIITVTIDQRGALRSTTAPDIGAFESQVPTLSVNPDNTTYGTALANGQLTGTASVVFNSQTVNVPGVFTFTSAGGQILNAGANQTETVTFTPNDSVDYQVASGSVIVNVAPATPTISVTDAGGVYNGSPYGASGTVSGVNGSNLGSPYYEYFLQGDTSFSHPSSTAPTNVGSYVVIGFSQPNSNYVQVGQAQYFSITPATPTISVTDIGGVYNGAPYAATGASSIGAPYYEYFLQSDTTFSHPSTTAPTNVGSYVVIGFSPANSNYNQVGQAQYFSITPATPTISVTDNGGVYTGLPYAASGTTSIGSPYYEYFLQSDTTFSHPSTTAPTNVGSYVAIGFSPANSNYVQVGKAVYFSIAPASTSVAISSSAASGANYGQSVTFSAKVSAVAPGGGTPVGSVQFFSNGTSLGTVALVNGSASISSSSLPPGADAITATYIPNSTNFSASTGSITQTISLGVLLLDSSGCGALTVTGGAKLVATGTSVVVDSKSSSAISASGSGSVQAGLTDVVGSACVSGGASVQNLKTGQASVSDPFASLPTPTTAGLTTRGTCTTYIGSNSVVTLQPGLYIGGINIGGAAKVTLAPGEYYLQGGGFVVGGAASVTDLGKGVLIYNAAGICCDQINISGAASVSLSPQTTGVYAGITIFQARNSNAQIVACGSGVLNVTGAVYAADALVNISGGSSIDTFGTTLIADDLLLTGSGELLV